MNFSKHLQARKDALKAMNALHAEVETAAEMINSTLKRGHKLLVCGNGGSAAAAQHFSGELVGRFRTQRRPLPAISLTADAMTVTCIANDFGFEHIFSRQIEALGQADDLLVVFSSSGDSPNLLEALKMAKKKKMRSLAFLGQSGGEAAGRATHEVRIPHPTAAVVQEGQLILVHIICERIEEAFPVAVSIQFSNTRTSG